MKKILCFTLILVMMLTNTSMVHADSDISDDNEYKICIISPFTEFTKTSETFFSLPG